MSSIAQPLVFPEVADFISKPRTNKKISFTYLLAIIYIYGGVSAFIWIISKTILQPLFDQLTYDRRLYHNKAIDLVRDFNVKLSSAVSFIPAVRDSLAGEKYSDAQTQTDSTCEKATSSSTSFFDTSVFSTATMKSNGSGSGTEKSVSFEQSFANPGEEATARTTKLCSKLEVLSQQLSKFQTTGSSPNSINNTSNTSSSSYSNSKLNYQNVDSLRYSLERLKSLSETLRSGVNLERAPGTMGQDELVTELKKQIRSFKGSFLSAKSFPSVSR